MSDARTLADLLDEWDAARAELAAAKAAWDGAASGSPEKDAAYRRSVEAHDAKEEAGYRVRQALMCRELSEVRHGGKLYYRGVGDHVRCVDPAAVQEASTMEVEG